MVLAMAMALMGINPEEFKSLLGKLTPAPKLALAIERPISPSSRSESSGVGSTVASLRSSEESSPWHTPFSSRAPSVRSSDGNTPSLTPFSSRPSTPTDEILKNEIDIVSLPLDSPSKPDFLNLVENLKDPRWQIVHPLLPLNDFQFYLNNQSVYHRVEENPAEDYPMRCCADCDFGEPSPYLFGELYVQKMSSNDITTQ